MATCSCSYIPVHRGREAVAYAEEHLRLVVSGTETWVHTYECPDHGRAGSSTGLVP